MGGSTWRRNLCPCAGSSRILIGKWRMRGERSPKTKINKITKSRRHPDLARITLRSVADADGSWNASLSIKSNVLLPPCKYLITSIAFSLFLIWMKMGFFSNNRFQSFLFMKKIFWNNKTQLNIIFYLYFEL